MKEFLTKPNNTKNKIKKKEIKPRKYTTFVTLT